MTRAVHYDGRQKAEALIFGGSSPATAGPDDLDFLARQRAHNRAVIARVKAQAARKKAIAHMKATVGR